MASTNIKKELLGKHLANFLKKLNNEPERLKSDKAERDDRILYYQSWTKERILAMSKEEMLEYISKLWAMLIWGNKQYVVDQMINDNGFAQFKTELAEMIWGKAPIEQRWDHAMKSIKHMGPAMMSELLCHVYPNDYLIWNRRAFVGFNYLGIPKLPRYNYQLTGKKYKELSAIGKEIATEMDALGALDNTLLAVDYFLWEELQVEDNLSKIYAAKTKEDPAIEDPEDISKDKDKFIHNEVRDAIRDIGLWLGFKAEIEKKVADGSVVDAVWEATIGNMGRVLYVFEVQTKGSIDSLILNLLKAKNNPAVQGIVAISDEAQLEKIRKHAAPVLGSALKLWDYREVWKIHESLEFVNQSINKLKLVPDGF